MLHTFQKVLKKDIESIEYCHISIKSCSILRENFSLFPSIKYYKYNFFFQWHTRYNSFTVDFPSIYKYKIYLLCYLLWYVFHERLKLTKENQLFQFSSFHPKKGTTTTNNNTWKKCREKYQKWIEESVFVRERKEKAKYVEGSKSVVCRKVRECAYCICWIVYI